MQLENFNVQTWGAAYIQRILLKQLYAEYKSLPIPSLKLGCVLESNKFGIRITIQELKTLRKNIFWSDTNLHLNYNLKIIKVHERCLNKVQEFEKTPQ